jgi:hypothetical protein
MPKPARDDGSNGVNVIHATVNFNTPGVGSADTVDIGTLPAGAQICFAIAKVVTAFNAVTTNVLTVGTSAGSNADVLGVADIAEGSIGATVIFTAASLSFAVPTTIFAKYTQTGTAATAGQASIIIAYCVPTH